MTTTPREATATESRKRWRGRVGIALFWAALAVYYVFIMSAGRWTNWPIWTAMYDKQAEAFRAGHLYLLEPPSPGLLALRDPLNPANMHFWRWDHSFYNRRLYLYWGFVPAALLAAAKALLRVHTVVGDGVPVFFYAMGRAIVGTLLIRALARTVVAAPPRWAVWMATLVFVLANPVPYLLSRGAVYEQAIAAGSLFVLSGIYFGLRAVTRAGSRAGDLSLAASGLGFGLSAGSRISLLPTAGLLTAWTIVACWRAAGGGGWRRLLRPTLWAGVPALAIVMGQLTINFLRFGEWLEFGVKYQMGFTFLSGPRFIVTNLFLYLLEPVVRTCAFPYLTTKWNVPRAGVPEWVPWPADMRIEPAVGVLVVVPFLWLLLVVAPFWVLAQWRASASAPALGSAAPTPGPLAPWTRRWVLGTLAIASTVAALPALLIFSNSMRYEWDFVSALFLAAALASWWALRAPRSRAGRTAVTVLVVVLASASIGAGILLGFVGYFDNFMRHNPTLMIRLKQMFDLCRRH
jgi:hypothetical protein